MSQYMRLLLVLAVGVCFLPAQAQILIDESAQGQSQPRVGKEAAGDYFKKRERSERVERAEWGDSDRHMLLQFGTFLNDKAYRWGAKDRIEDVGEATLGVTYRVGEWRNSMDMFLRSELMSYDVDGESPLKLSLMPLVTFPDARSTFPLYFGAGAGLGIFFRQVGDESDLSFDYAVVAGLRFPTLFEWGGLVVETGLKGQVFLLSSGQQDGVYISAGTVFAF